MFKGKDKEGKGGKAKREKGSAKNRPTRRGSNSNITPPPGATTPQSEMDGSVQGVDVGALDTKTPK